MAATGGTFILPEVIAEVDRMRREYFELAVSNTDRAETDGQAQTPTLGVVFEGPRDVLDERLDGTDDSAATPETDVAYRFHTDADEPEATGVLGVTDRITGDFLLECDADATTIFDFLRAAREHSERSEGEGHYRVEVRADDEALLAAEKSTFLVYDHEGSLLRGRSLIPGGVEL
jgi:hypothetical protein